MAFGCDALRRIRFDECAGHARESMHRAFGNCIEGSRGRSDRPADLNSPAEEGTGYEARAPHPLYSPRPWCSPFGPACAVRARSHRAQSGPSPASGRRMGSVGLVPAGEGKIVLVSRERRKRLAVRLRCGMPRPLAGEAADRLVRVVYLGEAARHCSDGLRARCRPGRMSRSRKPRITGVELHRSQGGLLREHGRRGPCGWPCRPWTVTLCTFGGGLRL